MLDYTVLLIKWGEHIQIVFMVAEQKLHWLYLLTEHGRAWQWDVEEFDWSYSYKLSSA